MVTLKSENTVPPVETTEPGISAGRLSAILIVGTDTLGFDVIWLAEGQILLTEYLQNAKVV